MSKVTSVLVLLMITLPVEAHSIAEDLVNAAKKVGNVQKPTDFYSPCANYELALRQALFSLKKPPDKDDWIEFLLRSYRAKKLTNETMLLTGKALTWRSSLIKSCGNEGIAIIDCQILSRRLSRPDETLTRSFWLMITQKQKYGEVSEKGKQSHTILAR